jgi:hypothetical protein
MRLHPCGSKHNGASAPLAATEVGALARVRAAADRSGNPASPLGKRRDQPRARRARTMRAGVKGARFQSRALPSSSDRVGSRIGRCCVFPLAEGPSMLANGHLSCAPARWATERPDRPIREGRRTVAMAKNDESQARGIAPRESGRGAKVGTDRLPKALARPVWSTLNRLIVAGRSEIIALEAGARIVRGSERRTRLREQAQRRVVFRRDLAAAVTALGGVPATRAATAARFAAGARRGRVFRLRASVGSGGGCLCDRFDARLARGREVRRRASVCGNRVGSA